MATAIAKTLEVFRKRTPEEKQKYIYKLVGENNQLRNELKEFKQKLYLKYFLREITLK